MKVLYVGYYRERGDWGLFTKNNILALDSAEIDVAIRPISFSRNPTPPELVKFEKKDIEDCDVCIQHVFPNHMLATKKFKKSITILGNEFNHLDHSPWIEKLEQFDQVWVPSISAATRLTKTSIYPKLKVIPNCFDISRYISPQSPQSGNIFTQGKFKFYTMIDNNDYERLDKVIRCFHSEFDATDKAVLVIQTEEQDTSNINQRIAVVKDSLNLQKDASLYVKDVIVTKPIDESSDNMHNFCDCYVSNLNQRCLTSTEFDAMAFGKTPIVSSLTDATDCFGDKYSVSAIYQSNTKPSPTWKDTNNAKDFVILGCESETKNLMRSLYNEWLENPVTYTINKKKEAFETVKKFSFQEVGKTMKEILDA